MSHDQKPSSSDGIIAAIAIVIAIAIAIVWKTATALHVPVETLLRAGGIVLLGCGSPITLGFLAPEHCRWRHMLPIAVAMLWCGVCVILNSWATAAEMADVDMTRPWYGSAIIHLLAFLILLLGGFYLLRDWRAKDE